MKPGSEFSADGTYRREHEQRNIEANVMLSLSKHRRPAQQFTLRPVRQAQGGPAQGDVLSVHTDTADKKSKRLPNVASLDARPRQHALAVHHHGIPTRHRTTLLRLTLFIIHCSLFITPDLLFAQRYRQPTGPWSGELNIRSAILLDDEVLYAGARLGREILPTLSAGITLAILMEDATRRTRESTETIELLGAIGPSFEFSDQLRGRVDYYVSVSGGVGYARRRTTGEGGEGVESGLLLLAEPEIGLIGRLSRRLRLRVGLSGLVGRIGGSDSLIYGGPTASFGVRMSL